MISGGISIGSGQTERREEGERDETQGSNLVSVTPSGSDLLIAAQLASGASTLTSVADGRRALKEGVVGVAQEGIRRISVQDERCHEIRGKASEGQQTMWLNGIASHRERESIH